MTDSVEILRDQFGRTFGKVRDLQKFTDENWLSTLALWAIVLVVVVVITGVIYFIYSRTTDDGKPLPRTIILGYPFLMFMYFSFRSILMFITVLLSGVKNIPIIGWLAEIVIFGAFYILTVVESWDFILRIPIWIFTFLILAAKNLGGQPALYATLGSLGTLLIVGLIWNPHKKKPTTRQ